MNIHELSNYNLADAIKFHNSLNPRLWGKDEHLRPEVREKLLEIAEDFREFLGVSDLDIKDITVSGSNAALSYTPHSDIDLHLVVNMPNDPVYRELFDAKKYQYNDMHNIKVRGYDVELYVQDAGQEHHSQGIYSVLNSKWISVPKRQRANVDDVSTRSKYKDLVARIEQALESKDINRVNAVWEHIKNMRKSGLAEFGEFGPENLAFKILRTQGYIKQLIDARAEAKDRELSLKERERQKQRVRYGFGEASTPDGVSPTTCMFLNEQDAEGILQEFIKSTAKKLGIERMPEVILHRGDNWSTEAHSFGRFDPDTHTLHVSLDDRHVLDILRTTAHELAHCRQHEIEPLPVDAGETGSEWENEAHAVAGVIMRDFADSHPDYFGMEPLEESASGYIPTKKQANDPRYKMALTVDIKPGQVGKEANKMALNTDKQGKPSLIYKSANQLAESATTPVQAFIEKIYSEYPVSPFNPRQHAVLSGEGENQTIALFELEPSKSVKDAVELHWIQAYPQRQGVGTAAIRELQVKAREAGIKMSLYPKPNGSVSQTSLKRLYKRLGFMPIHKGAATMVWDPAVNEQQLTELADSPYPLQFAQHGANKSRYGFETDSGAEYMIDVYPASSPGAFQNNLLSIGFALVKDGEEVDTATGTAGADSLRIFGTVLAATKDALDYRTKQGLDIEYIQFAAKHAEPSRVSLYQRFAKNIGRYLPGWEFVKVTKNDEYVRFIVRRSSNKNSIEQELDEDWRNWVSGLGAASMIAGGGSAAYDAYKQQQTPQTQPAQVQQVSAPKAKVQAPAAAPTTQQTISQAQDLLATKGAQILQKAAKAAGLKGNELAQFMAQCAHETANFTTLEEFGDKNYFKKYDIKFNPAKAKELGNVHAGDGARYKGRGFIQLTGRENYRNAGKALGLPLEQKPELVERPDVAAKVALWFWQNRVQPKVDNFSNTTQATKPINPGLKGLQDRHNKFTGMKVAMAKPTTLTKTAAQAPAAKIAAKPAAAKTKVAAKPQKVKKV